MKAQDRWKDIVKASKDAIENFNDFADDRVIVWANEQIALSEKIHGESLSSFYGLVEAKEQIELLTKQNESLALASDEIIKQSVAMYRAFREDNLEITHLEAQESCEMFEYELRSLLPKKGGAA